MSKRWVLADVETTGLKPTDRVVEVAWMEIDSDFRIIRQDASIIDPLCPIPAATSAVHGITNKDVFGKPTLDEYMNIVLGGHLSHGDMVFVAHNAGFDYQFLSPYLPEGIPQLCTVRLARRLYPDLENHKLGTIVYALDLDVERERFHSADGDMAILLALLGRVHEDFGHSLGEMLDLANAPVTVTHMPFGAHKGKPLSELPAGYIKWLKSLENLDRDLRVAIEAL